MKLIFNTNGNERQKDVARHWIDNSISDIVYGGSKGSGKSYLGCSLIFGDAFIYPETHYFIARKELNNIRKYTIPSIHEVFNHWGINQKYYTFNGQDNYFKLYNASKVFLLDAKYLPSDPEYYRFGSMQMTRGWIEEAGEFEENAKNNLSASVGRWKNELYNINGKILQTCNPSKNYLYSSYYIPNKRGDLDDWKRFVQALPSDNKSLDKGYLDNLNRVLTNSQKERLLKGNWEYDDDPNALCHYDNIVSIFTNIGIDGDRYLTADVARMGSDKSVILVWNGYRVVDYVIYDKSKTTEIQTAITALRTKYNIPLKNCIADEDGVGGGVVDNLNIKGFVNNSRALNDENYFNLQSQCCYKLADAINEYKISISCDIEKKYKEEIIEELEQLKSFNTENNGKLKILPKEKIKDAIGRSPDWRDALMMRMWFDYKSFKPTTFY
jgi:phage terminase large subunit